MTTDPDRLRSGHSGPASTGPDGRSAESPGRQSINTALPGLDGPRLDPPRSVAAAPSGDSSEPGPERSSPEPCSPEALTLPAGVHHLCACGLSRHGWHCDGAHLGSGRVSHELLLRETTTVMLCRCARSRRYPLCDGSHEREARRPRWRFW